MWENGIDIYSVRVIRTRTNLYFGVGAIQYFADIADQLTARGITSVLVVTGRSSYKRTGAWEVVEKILNSRKISYALYDRVTPNPTTMQADEATALGKGIRAQAVIAIGGGSPIDASKAIAVMAANPGDYWDYVSGGTGRAQPIPNPPLPIVAVTTTAGTGTEADPWTVITKEDTNEKIGFGCAETFPVLSVVDPEMMLTIPAHLTAYQGFDALFHATEGYIANVATPLSDAYALKSIELLAKYLPAAVKDGSDLEARTQVALASTLSGMVESTSCCTSEHGMEHALSAFYPKLPHGAGLIMLSEAYYSFFADKAPERFTAMAKAMGVVTGHLPEAERPMAFVKALVELQKACGVDGLKMSDYGITKEDMAKCAANARHTMGGLFELDPYALSLDETTQIMMNAYK